MYYCPFFPWVEVPESLTVAMRVCDGRNIMKISTFFYGLTLLLFLYLHDSVMSEISQCKSQRLT